jgi:16S rRNA (cytidine1402-2'-O)-methyltransferase
VTDAVLSLVATPIGNLSDISQRALDTLRAADVIACEDTRHSLILLRHYGIEKPLVSYHEHNEAKRTAELIEQLVDGKKVAVISDAGLPGISDPGHRLLKACIERGVPYTIIPGASAVLTALIGSGFNSEQFFYGGFLPVKSGGRERDLLAAAARAETSVFFESPHRILKTLAVCAEKLPERLICVARELTKTFEEYRRGTGPELLAHYTAHPAKGEIVLVISGTAERGARRVEYGE